jgi:hypothetical protein
MHLRAILLASAAPLLSFACGGGAQSAPAPSTAASSAAATASAAPEATPPPPPLHPQAAIALRIDMARLRETPLYHAVMTTLGPLGIAAQLDAANTKCGFSIPEGLSAVALSVAQDESVVITATTAKSRPPETALACVRALGGTGDMKLDDGTPAVRLGSDGAAAVKDGILYVGQPDAIVRTAARGGAGTSLEERVTLSGDTVMAVSAAQSPGGPVSAFSGRLRASDKEFWLDGEVETASEGAAAELAKSFGRRYETPTTALDLGSAIKADGKVVRVHLGVQGGSNEQAHMIGQLAFVAIRRVRGYMAEA